MGWVEGLHADAVLVWDLEKGETQSLQSRTEQPSSVLRESTQSRTTTQDSWAMPSALLLVSPVTLLVSLNFPLLVSCVSSPFPTSLVQQGWRCPSPLLLCQRA